MKKIIKIFCFIFVILIMSGCTKDSMENIKIYTSIYPIEYIANELYGNYSTIVSMYPSDVNPYEYKLTQKQLKNFSTSDLIIYDGLGSEKDYIVQMSNYNKKLKIIDSTAKIEYTNSIDEIWINPSNVITIAENIKSGLYEYISSKTIQDEIDKNYESLKLDLSTIDANIKDAVENAKDKNIVIADDDLIILSKYGLEITSIDEKTLTDKELSDAKYLLNNDKIDYIFVKKGYKETDTMKNLKSKYDAKYLEIDMLNNISSDNKNNNKNYLNIMNENIDKLKEELY